MVILMVLISWILVLVFIFCLRNGFSNNLTRKSRNRFPEHSAGGMQQPKNNKQSVGVSSQPETMSPSCRRKVFLVIVLFSAPNQFDRRNAIRRSWGTLSQNNQYITEYNKESKPFKLLFLLGQSRNEHVRRLVTIESQKFGDIVIGQFIDIYNNLMLKTKLGLAWAYQHCQFQYLLKSDDDCFVNINGLLQWLWKTQARTGLYTGHCESNKTVERRPGRKWQVNRLKSSFLCPSAGDMYRVLTPMTFRDESVPTTVQWAAYVEIFEVSELSIDKYNRLSLDRVK